MFEITLGIQLLLFVQPYWSLYLPCRSFVPAFSTLLVMNLSSSRIPYLQLACQWTPSIIAAPSSPGLGKSLGIFHPSSRKSKKFLLNVSVRVWPCFTTVHTACRVRCNGPANKSGSIGKLRWNRRLFIQSALCRCMSLCVCGISTTVKLYLCNRARF